MYHLKCSDCTFVSLIAKGSATAVQSLLQSIACKQTIDNRHDSLAVELGKPLCRTLADIVKVRCITAYYTTYCYYGIHIRLLGHPSRSVNEFETTRNGLYNYVGGFDPVFQECVVCSLEQCSGNILVPLTYYDAYLPL